MSPDSGEPRPWTRLGSEAGPDLILFRARYDLLRNPRNGRDLRRLVLETPDWVNVIPLTPERRLVVVRQYRFGSGRITAEIPGGMVDAGEDSGAAARRELEEETGYTSDRWSYLGCVEVNPSFHDNLCHHWLAEDVRRTHTPRLDDGEDIHVTTLSLDDAREATRKGEIRHSLVIAALARLLDLRAGPGDSAAEEGPGVSAPAL